MRGLQFVRILQLADAPGSIEMPCIQPAAKAINDIRNAVAHTLDVTKVDPQHLSKLESSLLAHERAVPEGIGRLVEDAARLIAHLLAIDVLALKLGPRARKAEREEHAALVAESKARRT